MTIVWFLIGWLVAGLVVAYFVGGAVRLGEMDTKCSKKQNNRCSCEPS